MALLYLAVRRWTAPAAGLIAGTVLALTPVAALMFRFNNPDALLVLLLVAAAYTTIRATEKASLRWLVATGVARRRRVPDQEPAGVPAAAGFALVYLTAAPTSVRRRVRDLLLAGVAMLVAGGWWVALVELWPAASRPYIGGSQTNSRAELIMGYNGLGPDHRRRGRQRDRGRRQRRRRCGARPGGTGCSQARAAVRSPGSSLPRSCWLAAALVLRGRAPRTDSARAAVMLWAGWLAITGPSSRFASGIIHEYYTVALAPAIAALVGIGVVELWRRREHLAARADAGRDHRRLVGLGGGAADPVGGLVPRAARPRPRARHRIRLVILLLDRMGAVPALVGSAPALVAVLLAPAAYSLQTAATAHTGSLPSAGPAVSGGAVAGPSAAGCAAGRRGRRPQAHGHAAGPGQSPARAPADRPPRWRRPQAGGGTGPDRRRNRRRRAVCSTRAPRAPLCRRCSRRTPSYTWVAAAVGAQTAAGYQLATE